MDVPASIEPTAVLKPLRDRQKLDRVMNAVSSVDLTETKAWDELDKLSARIRIDAIDAVPGAIFEVGDSGFAAMATVYVELGYGTRKDGFSAPDNFPATVHGHFDPSGMAIVDTVSVNTSSFYK
jgi:hypothetical protein